MKISFSGESHEIHEWLKGMGKHLNREWFEKYDKRIADLVEVNHSMGNHIDELKRNLEEANGNKAPSHLEAMKDVIRKGKAWAKENRIPFDSSEIADLYLAITKCPDVDTTQD